MQIVSQIIKQSLVNWKSLKWLQSSKLKDIGEHGITKLKNSLKENNFVQPFNVWEDSKGVIWILDGHHREKALTQLEAEGYEIPETLPANFISCKDKKEAAKMVLLYSSIYAKITNEGLGEFLDDFDLDLSNLINEIDLPGLDFDNFLEPETLPEDIDEAPQPLEKTYSILGDVFEIDGKHRVMCGDSTKESDVSILMNGNKADMVFTDPPYGINIVGTNGQVGAGNLAKNQVYNKVIGDDTTDAANDFYNTCIALAFDKYIIFGGNYFLSFLPFSSSWIIWDKRGDMNSNNFADGEMAWTNIDTRVRIYKQVWNGMIREGESEKRVHPTQKPIMIFQHILNDFTQTNEIIYDGFLGSGSTLIAAETTKRICYGMEIDQHYSDVILRRYKKTFPNAQFKCLTRPDFPFEELFNA